MSKWENIDLAQNLRNFASAEVLSDEEASILLQKLADLMGCNNVKSRWWWENSKSRPFAFSYGKNSDFYSELLKAAGGFELSAYIIVTADYTPPWPCFRAKIETIVDAVSNSSFAEFIIVGPNFAWAMVDNHHNQLLLYGSYEIDERGSD